LGILFFLIGLSKALEIEEEEGGSDLEGFFLLLEQQMQGPLELHLQSVEDLERQTRDEEMVRMKEVCRERKAESPDISLSWRGGNVPRSDWFLQLGD